MHCLELWRENVRIIYKMEVAWVIPPPPSTVQTPDNCKERSIYWVTVSIAYMWVCMCVCVYVCVCVCVCVHLCLSLFVCVCARMSVVSERGRHFPPPLILFIHFPSRGPGWIFRPLCLWGLLLAWAAMRAYRRGAGRAHPKNATCAPGCKYLTH